MGTLPFPGGCTRVDRPAWGNAKAAVPQKGTAAVVVLGATAAEGSLAERSEAREAVGTYLASALTGSLAPP
ncbi:hypothetical protein QF036_001536 [Arthrobacter globiformis]|nr:hypothetical protein [Arthrobacter globiformis]